MTVRPTSDLTAHERRRLMVGVVIRALLTVTVLVALYYAMPIDGEWRLSAGLRAVAGLALFLVVLTWQIRTVLRSKHPGIRAIEAVALTIPLFLLLFASTYFLMSVHGSGAFSQEDLTRTDALYLAVTIFSTVGFGDISATSQAARLVATSQMILDLLILGIVINAFAHAARLGRQRNSAEEVGQPTSA